MAIALVLPSCVMPTVFFCEGDAAVLPGGFENRSIDIDSGRNREDFESAKFSFEFKSGNF